MDPAGWATVITATAGLITAVTALISALMAHDRITAGQSRNPAAAGSSPPSSPGRSS